MKIGDLIEVTGCPPFFKGYSLTDTECRCFFCSSGSNRIGVILGPSTHDQWHVMFDTGMWKFSEFDAKCGHVAVIHKDSVYYESYL